MPLLGKLKVKDGGRPLLLSQFTAFSQMFRNDSLQKNLTPHEDCRNLLKSVNRSTLTMMFKLPRIPTQQESCNYVLNKKDTTKS